MPLDIVEVRCRMQIQVVASIAGTSGGTANALQVTINEIAGDLRAAFEAENYIWQMKNAQSNQHLVRRRSLSQCRGMKRGRTEE